MLKKLIIISAILLLSAISPTLLLAGEDRNIHYKFNITDSSYSFHGSFKIKADVKCLLEITFNFNHIRALVPEAKEVILLDQDSNCNQIKYTFQKYLLFVNTSVWHRVLDAPGQRVDFTLLSSINNLSIMPELISSTGYYQISRHDDYLLVEYYHECLVTDKPITKLYLKKVKKEAIRFLYFFSDYACDYCKCSPFFTNHKR